MRFYGVMVITADSESANPSSTLGRTSIILDVYFYHQSASINNLPFVLKERAILVFEAMQQS